VICAVCREKVPRSARQQTYCSNRCRWVAYRNRRATAKISEYPARHTGRATEPPKSSSKIKGLQRPKWRPSPYANAPLNLCGGGWHWPDAPTLDRDLLATIFRAEIGGVR
jgi:hypothetical protein